MPWRERRRAPDKTKLIDTFSVDEHRHID